MIIPIPTNLNSRHLADAAYKARDDYNDGRITQDEALSRYGLFSEVLDRLEKRVTPTGEGDKPAGVL